MVMHCAYCASAKKVLYHALMYLVNAPNCQPTEGNILIQIAGMMGIIALHTFRIQTKIATNQWL